MSRPTNEAELMEHLGHNLKHYRNLKGLTQKELSEEMNVNRVTIARIESGNRLPSLQFALNLSEVLECSIGDLVSKEEAVA